MGQPLNFLFSVLGRVRRRWRDILWSIVFHRVAIIVVSNQCPTRARISHRVGDTLFWRYAGGRVPESVFMSEASLAEKLRWGKRLHDVPISARGELWAPGWEGKEVEALEAATALL